MTNAEIQNVFTYHAPVGTQAERYTQLRNQALELAIVIQAHCPESREKSLAITHLQESVMWANASIALNENEPS